MRGRAHLSVIEWDLDAQGPRIEPNRRGLQPWLLHLPATMTWSKLLEPQSAIPETGSKNSIYYTNIESTAMPL